MSAPSRRPEIRRRRTRKEKTLRLRKKYARVTSEAERKHITDKLHRIGLVSPGQPLSAESPEKERKQSPAATS